MVSILPAERTPFDVFGRQFRESVSAPLQRGVSRGIERGQIQEGLKSLEGIPSEELSRMSPLEIAHRLIAPFAGTEQGAQYAKSLLPFALEQAKLAREQRAKYPQERDRSESLPQTSQRTEMPNFLGRQEGQFHPSLVPPEGSTGNLPQPATSGEIIPIPNRDEKIATAKNLAEELKIPIKDALAIVNDDIEDIKARNAQVEKERGQRVLSQRDYGEKGSAELLRLNPSATPEQQAVFKKIAENMAGKYKSEADIDRAIAIEAAKFRNTIKNVEDTMSAPRLVNSLQRKFLGSQRDIEQASNDLKVKLKPLLDLELYDTARNLLEKLGYFPEERENVIHPLSEIDERSLNSLPIAQRTQVQEGAGFLTPSLAPKYQYAPGQKQNVVNGLKDLFDKDRDVSLVLARKGFEDRGYGWDIFKDALNDLVLGGDFEPNDDQQIQMKYLDEPPLDGLQRILYNLGFRGR